jgi:ribonuclease P protein component
VIAPKKKYPTAVQRNRCKRLLREAWIATFKTNKSYFNAPNSHVIIWMGKGKASATLADYCYEMQKILNKLNSKNNA